MFAVKHRSQMECLFGWMGVFELMLDWRLFEMKLARSFAQKWTKGTAWAAAPTFRSSQKICLDEFHTETL